MVELLDGSVKYDMICGIGVHFFGHSDADLIREAVEGGIDDTVKHGNLQSNFELCEFGEVLLAQAKKHSRLKHVFVSTSGTAMANENAVKVCYQKHAPANRVIAFKDCFMGRSVTMCQIGDTAEFARACRSRRWWTTCRFRDADAAARMGKTRFIDMGVSHLTQYLDRYPGQHACFIFELMQGEGGFNVGDRDYFKGADGCLPCGTGVWRSGTTRFSALVAGVACSHTSTLIWASMWMCSAWARSRRPARRCTPRNTTPSRAAFRHVHGRGRVPCRPSHHRAVGQRQLLRRQRQ